MVSSGEQTAMVHKSPINQWMIEVWKFQFDPRACGVLAAINNTLQESIQGGGLRGRTQQQKKNHSENPQYCLEVVVERELAGAGPKVAM